jgi:hypothetical protein
MKINIVNSKVDIYTIKLELICFFLGLENYFIKINSPFLAKYYF